MPGDEIVRAFRLAMTVEIGGCRGEHALAIHDAAHAQAGIFQHTQPEGHVDALFHDVDFVVGEPQPHLYLGIAVAEFRNAGGDQPASKAERCSDLDGAARLPRQCCDGSFSVGDRFQDMPGPRIEGGAVLGRHELPRGPVEQADPEIFLQFLDAVRGDGG